MRDDQESNTSTAVINFSALAIVAFLAAVLYFFGTAMSGDTQLTQSVAGAQITDNRDAPQ